jgi:hypothetical protein
MKEALYVVEFGDFLNQTSYQNGGVAVLETGRIFGVTVLFTTSVPLKLKIIFSLP